MKNNNKLINQYTNIKINNNAINKNKIIINKANNNITDLKILELPINGNRALIPTKSLNFNNENNNKKNLKFSKLINYLQTCNNYINFTIIQLKNKNNGNFLKYSKVIGYNFTKGNSNYWNNTIINNTIINNNNENNNNENNNNENNNSDKIIKKLEFNKDYSLYTSNTYKLLFLFFKSMYCLISKPVFTYTPEKITIELFYYLTIPKKKVFKYFSINNYSNFKKKWLDKKNNSQQNTFRSNNYNTLNINRINNINNRLGHKSHIFIRWKLKKSISRLQSKTNSIRNLLFNLRKFQIVKVFNLKFKLLLNIISKFSNKPIELQLIRLHDPKYDSNILLNLLSLNIKNKRKKSRVAIQNIYNKNKVRKIKDLTLINNFNIPAFLSGIFININGRLMREPMIPRLTTKEYQKGANSPGKVNYLDVATITKKNRKGAFTIKVSSAQNFY